MIDEILKYNEEYVKNENYKSHLTDKFPDKKIAILSCMDTRLSVMLTDALGLKNGDVKMIKNAGAVIHDPFGGEVRSLLVAIYELGVEEIMVIGHTDCGVGHINGEMMINAMVSRGISKENLAKVEAAGVDINQWLRGFDDVSVAVGETVELLKNHPLIPDDVQIGGYVMDVTTGKLLPLL